MIDKVREHEHGAIMFFGRPEYYPQFGFVESDQYGVTDKSGDNYPEFMCMELIKGYLSNSFGVSLSNQISLMMLITKIL